MVIRVPGHLLRAPSIKIIIEKRRVNSKAFESTSPLRRDGPSRTHAAAVAACETQKVATLCLRSEMTTCELASSFCWSPIFASAAWVSYPLPRALPYYILRKLYCLVRSELHFPRFFARELKCRSCQPFFHPILLESVRERGAIPSKESRSNPPGQFVFRILGRSFLLRSSFSSVLVILPICYSPIS